MDNKKKFFALTLVCLMLFSVVPVFAATENNTGNSTNENNTANTTVTPIGNGTNHTIPTPTPTPTPTHTQTPTTHNNAPIFTPTAAYNGSVNQTGENDSNVTPTVNFTANVTDGKAPLSVLFTSNGTGNPDVFVWYFGDGVYSTHNWTAIHTYTQPGKYNVSVTVANAAGNNTSMRLAYINVSKTRVINNRILCSGIAPLKVSFKDKSKKHIWSIWNVGEGPSLKTRYVLHIYKKPGKYPVTLKYETVGHVKKKLHAGYIIVK